MAQVDSQNNPNDPNNPNSPATAPNQIQQGANQPATTGGGGAVTATGAGNVTGQVVGTAQPSQPFQNIASYLSANAPQSKDLAQQVAGTVSAPITEAQTGITNAAQNFTQSVNAGYTPENKDLITAVSNNPAYVVGENPENVNNFLAQLNNKYTGPSDFTTDPAYADLQAKIAQAQTQANNTNSESGIQSLLGAVEGPTTAGINKFDSLLLSANPDNYKAIQAAGAPAANLMPTLNQTATDQNALAAKGATTASQTAAEALAALNTARGSESTNLTNEQGSIQDIVNQYNKSVGIINPVVQTITQAISNFFANNPNIKIPTSGDPLADIKNLTSIVMPELATYASPEDYAQIAALTQLGDANVGNLPISSATANQAQTFNIPTALQDAIGKAPGVEAALQSEIGGIGTQLNDAVKPYTDAASAAYNWATYGQPAMAQSQQLDKQIAGIQSQIADLEQGQAHGGGDYSKQIADYKSQMADLQTQKAAADATVAKYPTASWDTVGPIAQSLQWVNPTGDAYQELINQINSELGKLGQVGIPSLSYGPSAAPAVSAGAPIGVNQAAKIAATGTQVGIPAATATGLLSAAVPTTASALAAAGPGAVAGEVPMAGLTGLQSIGPAGVAAYGTSNIIKNAAANPIKAGLGTLANMGISLATLSLPPQIFKSIGKDISKVVKSIGDFFGGLF